MVKENKKNNGDKHNKKQDKKDEVFEKVLQQHIVVAELREFYRNLYYQHKG